MGVFFSLGSRLGRLFAAGLLLGVALGLAACGAATPEPNDFPPRPTDTSAPPTALPAPASPTPIPSPTVPEPTATEPVPTSTPADPSPAGSPIAIIDWVDLIQFNGIQYIATHERVGRALTATDLGPEYAHVQFQLANNVHDPHYQPKDGDASYREPGTIIYTVNGYQPHFRLAVRLADGTIVCYEADTNAAAQTGADLLDLGGKVNHIGINSQEDGTTELGAIGDPQQVAELTALVLAAPITPHPTRTGTAVYFIVFYLADGTAVSRAYWPDSGELDRGILAPPAFRTAVEAALQK